MKEPDDSVEVQLFMAAFQKLRDRIADKPESLVEEAIRDNPSAELCNDVYWAARPHHEKERSRHELFSARTNPSFVKAWRDYESNYIEPVGTVSFWLACDVLPV
jgi:hypothetical protein